MAGLLRVATFLLLLVLASSFSIPSSSTISMTTPPSSSSEFSVDEIYSLVDAKGKHGPPTPASTVAALVVLGVPTLLVVLPISIIYQLGKTVVDSVSGGVDNNTKNLAPIDSGVQVNSDDIIPLEDRKYDLVVMGATGFTGSLCVRYLAKTYGINKETKWAIAGRSQSKLDKVKQRWAEELGNDDILKVDTIIVDTTYVHTYSLCLRTNQPYELLQC